MSEQVYKSLELTGASATSIEDAISTAIQRASKTIRNIKWFEVIETRGAVDGGAVSQWQVTIKLSFSLE